MIFIFTLADLSFEFMYPIIILLVVWLQRKSPHPSSAEYLIARTPPYFSSRSFKNLESYNRTSFMLYTVCERHIDNDLIPRKFDCMASCKLVVGQSVCSIDSAMVRANVVLTRCSPHPDVLVPTEMLPLLAQTPQPQTPACKV